VSISLKPLLAKIKADIFVRKYSEDGGPGSGNWGHAGRPGLVGGSAAGAGKGGGKQYRGGRSDIGFFNSRNDWLNGLTGERQHDATKLLKAVKEKMSPTSEETPEAHIMKNMSEETKGYLLDLVGEARSWKDRGFALVSENLSNDEFLQLMYMANHLEEKYGGPEQEFFKKDEYANFDMDRVYGLLSPEEREFYLDMKAKACGLPTSGKKIEEYSDEFQYEIGAKEEPKQEDLNRDWVKESDIEAWDRLQLNDLLRKMGMRDVSGNPNKYYDMNDIEREMQGALVKNLAEKNESYLNLVREYTRRKEKALGQKTEEILARGDSEVLTEDQRKYAKDILEAFAGPLPYGEKPENVADIAEEKMFQNEDFPALYKAYYLGLKMRVLGLTDRPPEEDLLEQSYGDFSRTFLATELENVKRTNGLSKKDRKALYFENRNKNKIVVAGDAMSEGVDKLRKESGSYTVDEVKGIGDVILPEFERIYAKKAKRMKALEDDKDAKYKAYREAQMKATSAVFSVQTTQEEKDALTEEAKRLWDIYWKSHEKVNKEKDESSRAISEVLSRIRKTGYEDAKALKGHFGNKAPSQKVVIEAYQGYPTEWIQASIDYGEIYTYKKSRGYYDGVEIVIDGTGQRAKEVATHELGHRFENCIPGIKDAEREFYNKRTEGEQTENLRKLTGIKGYRADEVTKKDNFVDPYIGKFYDHDAYEVVSMGFQYAFHTPEKLLKDKEYARLILGLLAVG